VNSCCPSQAISRFLCSPLEPPQIQRARLLAYQLFQQLQPIGGIEHAYQPFQVHPSLSRSFMLHQSLGYFWASAWQGFERLIERAQNWQRPLKERKGIGAMAFRDSEVDREDAVVRNRNVPFDAFCPHWAYLDDLTGPKPEKLKPWAASRLLPSQDITGPSRKKVKGKMRRDEKNG
jgi:hypothetical protein